SLHHVTVSSYSFCFSSDPRTSMTYTLSLHDALPIFCGEAKDPLHARAMRGGCRREAQRQRARSRDADRVAGRPVPRDRVRAAQRSEEHTSELQSRENLVCRLLLEKKKNSHVKDSYSI